MSKLPGISQTQAVRAFERLGFLVKRQSKHVVMTNGSAVVVIPRHTPINSYTMAAIVEGAGLTLEAFKQKLR